MDYRLRSPAFLFRNCAEFMLQLQWEGQLWKKDDPQLNVRYKEGFCPARIIFTSRSQIPQESYFYSYSSEARSIVVLPDGKKCIEKDDSGIEFWYTGESHCSTDHLRSFLETACEQGLTSIMVEGGSRLASQFIEGRVRK